MYSRQNMRYCNWDLVEELSQNVKTKLEMMCLVYFLKSLQSNLRRIQ